MVTALEVGSAKISVINCNGEVVQLEVTVTPVLPKPDKGVIIGDLNDSETIDITDLTLLSIHLIDKTELTERQKLAADTDGDGIISLTDLATLRQYLSKSITKLGK